MSDINIQRKSGSSAVWWVLGIVALLVVVWLLFAYTGPDRQAVQVDDNRPAVVAASVDVRAA